MVTTTIDETEATGLTVEEQTATRIALAEEAAYARAVADILTDLADWKTEHTGAELAGFLAAIQVIKSNY